MNNIEIIQWLWRYGHFRNPDSLFQDTLNVQPEDLAKLNPWDTVVRQAIQSFQESDATLQELALKHHNRPLFMDGGLGPATLELMTLPRCGLPDHGIEEALEQGVGNWKGCHNVGNYHCASLKILNNPPSHLVPIFDHILSAVQQSYAEAGLLLHFAKPGEQVLTPYQMDFSFVNVSSGWIGLATIGRNRTCVMSPIFCRYLATYRGGSTDEAIANQWWTLIKHEIGHNCGSGHVSGLNSVMNPSIRNGLPISWRADPLWNWLVNQFGGKAVPIPGGRFNWKIKEWM